jgi:hypothetical protein
MAKISKKQAQEISGLINSLLVYDSIVKARFAEKKYDEATSAMRGFNEKADMLNSMSISVIKFKISEI